MARFVARYPNYSHGVREEVAEQFARGSRIIQRGLEAQFNPRGLTGHEKEFAASELHFHGLPENKNTGADVSPMSRLSLFDSEKAKKEFRWTDEEHDLVVDTLRESDRYGLDFTELAQPKLPAPWNGYDKLTDAETILELTIATETSAQNVLAYELENENRTDVIAALEEILEPAEENAVVIDAGA